MFSGAGFLRLGLVACLLVGVVARAEGSSTWAAVARVSSSEEGALFERIQGQSSDLPVTLLVAPGPSLEGEPEVQWHAATELADEHQARAVLWFQRTGSDLSVHVAEPGSRHLFVRTARVEGRPGALEWSAGAEALALVVRSALRAVASGSPLGDIVTARPYEQLSGPVVPGRIPSPADAPVVPETPEDPDGLQWELIVGGLAALDGYTSAGHQGLVLGSGWAYPSVRVRFQLLAGFTSKLRDERTEVRLSQYTVGLWLDTPMIRHGDWRWSVGAGAGALFYSRTTEPFFRGVTAAKPRFIPGFAAGPDTSLRWKFSRHFALEGNAAVEALFGRPELGYDEGGTFVPFEKGWALRPRLSLAFMIIP